MLLRFEVSNHRSILDPVELSMIAVDEDRAATRGFDHLSERVLTVAGIYGPNASGKSTVLEALAWLSFAVRTSLHSWYRVRPPLPPPVRRRSGPALDVRSGLRGRRRPPRVPARGRRLGRAL